MNPWYILSWNKFIVSIVKNLSYAIAYDIVSVVSTTREFAWLQYVQAYDDLATKSHR